MIFLDAVRIDIIVRYLTIGSASLNPCRIHLLPSFEHNARGASANFVYMLIHVPHRFHPESDSKTRETRREISYSAYGYPCIHHNRLPAPKKCRLKMQC